MRVLLFALTLSTLSTGIVAQDNQRPQPVLTPEEQELLLSEISTIEKVLSEKKRLADEAGAKFNEMLRKSTTKSFNRAELAPYMQPVRDLTNHEDELVLKLLTREINSPFHRSLFIEKVRELVCE